jgi:CheY-like chemotaxis protein
LIVEDEILIRMYLDDLFQDAGWNVTAAANGEEAAHLLNGFDAVITDVEMPGQRDGVALAWAVYALNEGAHYCHVRASTAAKTLSGPVPRKR